MVLVIGQNSVWQKTYSLDSLENGHVNRIRSVYESAAGKGTNVCRSLVCSGTESYLLAYAGGTNGKKFSHACFNQDGLKGEIIPIEEETRVCTTLLESNGIMTELVEPAPKISEEERLHFHKKATKLLRQSNFLSINGTAVKGEDPQCYMEFVETAHNFDSPVLLDSYTEHGKAALAGAPDILKINSFEFSQLFDMEPLGADEKKEAYNKVLKDYNIQWVVITKGKDGMEGFNGNDLISITPPVIEAINPIGSGDASSAGIIHGILRKFKERKTAIRSTVNWKDGAMLREALGYSTAFGTANCLNKKPGFIRFEDIDAVKGRLKIEKL